MRAPRVLQVVLSLNPGGTERLVVELVARLNAEVPMMVCCLDDAGLWAGEVQAQGVEVHALGRAPGFRPALGLAVERLAHRHGAGVIHAHHYSPMVYSCLARLRRPAIRVVYTEHGRVSDAPPSRKRWAANQVLSRFPHRVFAVSEDLKQHMVSEGFGSNAVSVIHNGVQVGPLPDPDARAAVRRELNLPDDALVIGTIGRLDPVKNFETLIDAVSRLAPAMQATLIIVGDGPERQRLEETARGMRVRLLGHRDDARRWLAGCDVYVNSSVSEGVSLTILEAMAAGLPVIATRVGGTPEVLDESCARLVPARDARALAGALNELAQSPSLRHTLGHAARHRVEAQFSLDRMVCEYRGVYQSLVQGSGIGDQGSGRTDR